jgi:ferric-dicitrate binding protein FerR (iron transport regulator)
MGPVRGTKWAVEVKAKQTSVLTISGVIDVKRREGKGAVSLKAGEGVDVSGGRALLARFGQ